MTMVREASKEFEDYTKHFSKFNISDPSFVFPGYHLNIGSFLPRDQDAPILDFGCGMGHFLQFLRTRGYANGQGIDVSRSQIEHCLSIGLRSVSLTEDPLTFLKDHLETFELIVALDVFEHLQKPTIIPTLRAIRAALKPRGRFVMRVPNIAAAIGPWTRYMDFTHELSYCDRSAYQILDQADFSDIQVLPTQTPYNHKWRGKVFELLRSGLYLGLRFVYTLQAPGTSTPKVFTSDLIAVGVRN
jgi:SAM-dependent methyltransferase